MFGWLKFFKNHRSAKVISFFDEAYKFMSHVN